MRQAMKTHISIVTALCLAILAGTSCNDFLTEENTNKINSDEYFSNEASLKIYTNGFIRDYATPIMSFIGGDAYSDTQSWDGSYLFYTDAYTAENGTGWSTSDWASLRSINFYLDNMRKADCSEAVLDHYEGVGRFFRALFYFEKLKTFGAVPYYTKSLSNDDPDLYKARDSREEVCHKILEDLDYACEHCSDDASYRDRASYIHKYVALALKSRFCLYEGTYRKYHATDPTTGKAWTADESEYYLRQCVDASEKIMESGVYRLADDPSNRATQYRDMFANEDAVGKYSGTEFIWARDYDLSLNAVNQEFSINDYFINAQHAQYSFNRDFVMTYLMRDGTPFTTKYPDYYKVEFYDECKDRDLRMAQTMRTPGFTRADGDTKWGAPDLVYARTGYQPVKYLTDYIKDAINDVTASDVPLMRYAEVLLNEAEAKAELGEMTEAVWNKTIKLLRERAGVKSIYPTKADPYMVKYFDGKVTDKYILEVRRERGIELTMENQRQNDIRRWNMGELLVRQKTGIWIPATETELDLNRDGKAENYVSATVKEKPGFSVLDLKAAAGHKLSEGDHGYILPNTALVAKYTWSDKKYLYPIPPRALSENKNLTQNNGW